MKRSLILVLVLAGLAALAWYLSNERGSGTLQKELTEFVVRDTSAVTRIFIAEQRGGTVDLQRTGDGWVVDGKFPARQSNIDLLLKTLIRIEVRSPVPKAGQENVLRVMSSTGKKVEIYTGNNDLLKTWYVGHATQDHFGTYMLLETPKAGRSSVPYIMGMSGFTGFLSSRFHSDIGEWRSSIMVYHPQLNRISRVEVEHPREPENSFQLTFDDEGRFQLADGAGNLTSTADTMALQGVMIPLRKLNFENLVKGFSAHQRDSLIASTPARILRVATADGTAEEHRFYYKKDIVTTPDEIWGNTSLKESDPDRFYSVVNDTTLVLVQRHMFDRVLQPLSRLR